MPKTDLRNAPRKAYIVTGPTSGIGRASALALAKHGTIILVGRDRGRLDEVRKIIASKKGQSAISVVCDLSDVTSARRGAAEIAALNLPIAGVLNNAGIRQEIPTKSAQGWDMTFATNHLGPFAFTEALIPHLADGTNVLFVCSAVEDPERQPAKRFGFRGARYISAEACARGEWKPGGSTVAGFDSYATSKQCNLATVLEFAREFPRLHFTGIEPGVNPNTGLGRDAGPGARFALKYIAPLIIPLLLPFVPWLRTPKQAARVMTKILTDPSGQNGIYYDERGASKLASEQLRDPAFAARIVAETRALLATVPA
jgi:NAD(P)-dependent dehydrogenase (short-subunit alcohol dehydrogenase family)